MTVSADPSYNRLNYQGQDGIWYIGGTIQFVGSGKMLPAAGSQPSTAAALTDSTGGTPGATLALVTAPTALTDNGGGTADNTVAAMTAVTALTVTDGAGTNDGTIDAITNNATTIAAVQEIAAKIAVIATFEAAAKDNFKELTTAQAANRLAIVSLTNAVASLAAQVNALLAVSQGLGATA